MPTNTETGLSDASRGAAVTGDDIRMRRKVQQFGSSTLAITLPAGWAREQNIAKGDELRIQRDENSGSLLLVPDTDDGPDTAATIDAGSLTPQALERAVLSHYILGRNLIRVESESGLSAALLEAVETTERNLMGLGKIEQSRTHVDNRCSVAPSDFELPTLLARLWRTEATIREETIEAFLEGDLDRATVAAKRETQAEKLFHLFLRLLFATYRNPRLNETMGIDTGFPLIGYRSVAQDVMLMTKSACRIVDLVEYEGTIGAEPTETFKTVAEALGRAVDETHEAVIDPTADSAEAANEAIAALRQRIDEGQAYLETERPSPILELQRLLSTIDQIGRHAGDSAEVATHLAAREFSPTE